jgi:hypothetical protein
MSITYPLSPTRPTRFTHRIPDGRPLPTGTQVSQQYGAQDEPFCCAAWPLPTEVLSDRYVRVSQPRSPERSAYSPA